MEEKFIKFLKDNNIYDEKVLEFFKNNSTYVDFKDDDTKYFIGCYPKVENGILKGVNICVPDMEDEVTVTINIHEYVHTLELYKKLNKEYKETSYEEVLPVFYELIFFKENVKTMADYSKFYEEHLMKYYEKEYLMVIELYNDLIKEYGDTSIEHLEKRVKRLIKK